MNTPVKSLIGLSAVGGVAGGCYAISQQLSTKSINDKLKDNGYKILTDSSGDWGKILAQYKLVATGNSALKFAGVTIESEANLQEQCKKVLKESSSNSDSYNRGAKWCTVPRDMKDMLKSKGYRFLSTVNNTDNIDQSEWNARLNAHNDDTKNEKFTISPTSGNKLTHVKGDRDKMRDACRPLEAKKHYEQNFEADLKKAMLWCSEPN
ncbi:hypothetical protein A6V39_00015 [Candidatus Mycoplasma haematobovis]|uniref:Lipoprotein n=1 Tax=Candidatus Mycoplasma haematobovis TaxID=432608 RepID=A0A1A9QD91_9MOLU|nr:hypothetical protein [Candidatus Mycoplasma haematobovis]OAL10433.1 hypothetical protein A6V39_00015 [Candidatus Mycoplasma haematobovis]